MESLDLNRPMKRVRPGELYRAASSPDRSAVMAVRRSPSPEARTFEIWDPERIHLLAAHDGVRHVEAQLEVKDLRKNVAAASLLLLDREGTVVHQQGFIAVSGLPENYGDLDTPEGFELVDLAPEFTPLERSTGFIDIPGSVSHNGARTLDSEYKLMARIAEYCDELGDDAPNSGRVIIASSYDACLSCQRVMATFVQDRMRETNQDFVINFYSNTENPAERMSHFYDPKEVFVQDHQGERRKLFMSRVDRFQNVVRPRRD